MDKNKREVLDRAPVIAGRPATYEEILRPVLSRVGMCRYLNGDSIELDPSDYRTIIDRTREFAARPTADQQAKEIGIEQIDAMLDGVLRAAGSGLRHYTMPKSLDEMRTAMRVAIEAARSIDDQQAAGSAELTDEQIDDLCFDIRHSDYQDDPLGYDRAIARAAWQARAALDSRAQPVAAGELPPLPKAEHSYQASSDSEFASNWKSAYTADQMRAYGQQCEKAGYNSRNPEVDALIVEKWDLEERLKQCADSRPAGGATDKGICERCNGSGEGVASTTCTACNGDGAGHAATLAASVAQPGAEPAGWRDLAKRCLSAMKHAVSYGETGKGRPPQQTCLFEIKELEVFLASPVAAAVPDDVAKDAARWRAFRSRDEYTDLEYSDFKDQFRTDADELIDQYIDHPGAPTTEGAEHE